MDQLPHRDLDPVLTLYAHYFLAAELNHMNYRAVLTKLAKLAKPDRLKWQVPIYFGSWLGFLGVTCEGFKKINLWKTLQSRPEQFKELLPLAGRLNTEIKAHDDMLRKFRNQVFHLRDDTTDFMAFVSDPNDRIAWAEELQDLSGQFFSEYRILCQMIYVISDRRSEM